MTLVSVVVTALVLVGPVVSGPAAQSVGNAIGLGSTAVLDWNIAKSPVMLASSSSSWHCSTPSHPT